jgi:LysR family glycine cleavage system transcriptional activator
MQALQAFDAVARNGSVLKAAQALHLTHGAISHAVKGLEDALGVRLFARAGRRIRLTEAGEQLASRLGECLRGIESAITGIREERSNSLVVLADASFASRWLLPRLARYIAANPAQCLHLRTSLHPDRHLDEADVALCYLSAKPDQAECELLVEDQLFPVCSARPGARRPRQLLDLASFNLLRTYSESWSSWFAAAGLDWPEPATGPIFEETAHALQAAAAGSGVALARRSLMDDEGAGTELLRPFRVSARADKDLYAVRSLIKRESRPLRVFHDWVRRELASAPLDVHTRAAGARHDGCATLLGKVPDVELAA